MESQGGDDLYYGTGGTMATTTTRLTNFERWNTEQIGDFVRKLGFLDKEKDKGEGDKIKHFLHVNEVHVYMYMCIHSYHNLHVHCKIVHCNNY
jgi:hypothetical protein